MSGQNRRREQKRTQRLSVPRPTQPTIEEIVWGMASFLASDDPEWAESVTLALDRMPDAFAERLYELLDEARDDLRDRGWTDVAINDVEHLLWTPPDATDLERDLRLLVLLGGFTRGTAA